MSLHRTIKEHLLQPDSLRYAVRFGLVISVIKGVLVFVQSGLSWEMPMQMALYFVIAAVVALPLHLYNRERKRQGFIMDHIILLSVGLLVLGGMIHDQIAVRVSPEYYSIGHFPIPGVMDMTVLALIWGFLGTWWLGAALGIVLALSACAGEHPCYKPANILKLVLFPLLGIELIAWLMGAVGYQLTANDIIQLQGGYKQLVPKAGHAAFMADWWANGTAYALVIFGFVILCRHIWYKRRSQFKA